MKRLNKELKQKIYIFISSGENQKDVKAFARDTGKKRKSRTHEQRSIFRYTYMAFGGYRDLPYRNIDISTQ